MQDRKAQFDSDPLEFFIKSLEGSSNRAPRQIVALSNKTESGLIAFPFFFMAYSHLNLLR